MCQSICLGLHAASEAAQVSCLFGSLLWFLIKRSLGVCIGKYGKKGRKFDGPLDLFGGEKVAPGLDKREFPASVASISFAEPSDAFGQIGEREKWGTDVALGPIQKDAAAARDNDVAWIDVEVSDDVRNLQVSVFREKVLELGAEGRELRRSQPRRRCLGLLRHELLYSGKERRDGLCQRGNPRVAAARFQ